MNIRMPDSDERERNINMILDNFLPPKRTVISEIKRLMNTVGIRYAFRGVLDAVAASLIVSFGITLAVAIISAFVIQNNAPHFAFLPLIFLAPILYFTLLAFTLWKEKMTGTWQVLTSCRFNLKYVTAVRLMLVSVVGILFIPLSTLPLVGTAEYIKVVVEMFGAMFFYCSATLLVLIISESFVFRFVVPLGWILGWILLLIVSSPSEVESFLSNIPIASSAVAVIALFALYLVELRIFILRTTRRMSVA